MYMANEKCIIEGCERPASKRKNSNRFGLCNKRQDNEHDRVYQSLIKIEYASLGQCSTGCKRAIAKGALCNECFDVKNSFKSRHRACRHSKNCEEMSDFFNRSCFDHWKKSIDSFCDRHGYAKPNITKEQYKEFVRWALNHGCAFCGDTLYNSKSKTPFDHDHKTGQCFGFMHHKCNQLVEAFRKLSPAQLELLLQRKRIITDVTEWIREKDELLANQTRLIAYLKLELATTRSERSANQGIQRRDYPPAEVQT